MQVPTLVEPVAGHGFRATTGSPFDITVEAESRQEALSQLQETLRQRMAHGAEIVTVEAGLEAHPWQKFAGGLKDHPLRDDWQRAMADYRDQANQEADAG